jgi:hypothetical protein
VTVLSDDHQGEQQGKGPGLAALTPIERSSPADNDQRQYSGQHSLKGNNAGALAP